MPMQRERYPADWERIAFQVKEEAGWKCEQCGKQCRRPGEPFDTHRRTLTVAHLNHQPEDCRRENLRALCAPCHLRYNAKHHAETRRKNREKRQGMNVTHELKLWPVYGKPVYEERKNFEVRWNNDRAFQTGDTIRFTLTANHKAAVDDPYYELLRERVYRITYVLDSGQFPSGIEDGFCVFGFEPVISAVGGGE